MYKFSDEKGQSSVRFVGNFKTRLRNWLLGRVCIFATSV